MKLDFTKADLKLVRNTLYRYGIGESHPNFHDFMSDVLWEITLMMHRKPDYNATPGLKPLIIQRSIYTTMQKLSAKKRRYVIPEWRSASLWFAKGESYGEEDWRYAPLDNASVPSTVDDRIDAQRAFEMLPMRAQEVVVNRMMGDSDAQYAREHNVSKQGVSESMRRSVKKVEKEFT